MARDEASKHLPPEVLAREDFSVACSKQDLGEVFRLAKKWGGPGFTASHLARRCELTVARVQDYINKRRKAQSVDIFTRVCDGLRIPGSMFNLAARPWEETQESSAPMRCVCQQIAEPAAAPSVELEIPKFMDDQPWCFTTDRPHAREEIASSQREWLRVRQAPGVRGRELTELAAWLYPGSHQAPGGHVLAAPGWLLDEPVPLETVQLEWSTVQLPTDQLGPLDHILPLTSRGERYRGYSRAVRDLVRPRLLENRPSYRLLDIQLQERSTLTFGTTTFFEVFDVKQAIAHEFKAAWLASGRSLPSWDALPLRSSLGDTFNPTRLLMAPGVNTLTIRRDHTGNDHRFVLHERDGGKVADGGGLCHVMPAGEFQPSSVAPVDVRNDFSLWRNIMREFSEEFLGNAEHDGSGARSINYAEDEPFRSFELARSAGAFRVWYYGLILEPLELGAATMTVAVIDDDVFDRLFAQLVTTNDEGYVVGRDGRTDMPFTGEAIDRLDTRLSASALTLLHLAWRDRSLLV